MPSFISKGAEVLNATLRDLSRYKTLDVELTPQLLRSVKFNELTGEDEAMVSVFVTSLVSCKDPLFCSSLSSDFSHPKNSRELSHAIKADRRIVDSP